MLQQSAIRRGFSGTVGQTPLIRFPRLSEATGCEILGKAEFLNPSGSVKDRAALGIIQDAEEKGELKPGGVIVEGTAGNTGIGLAQAGLARGYRTIIVIPETQSQEKIDLLRAVRAEVHPVPAAPYTDPGNYNHVARRMAEETEGAVWANQFDNPANRAFHYQTTGPEVWEQTGGEVTAFVAAIGTGGTLAGVSSFLKEKSRAVRTICADPYGAAMYSWIREGKLETEGGSVTEGIGQGRVTKNVEGAPIDDAYRFHDSMIMEMLHFVLKKEGFFLGSSSAINLCGAVKYAREKGPGQVIVTPVCDTGERYTSRLFNREWLRERGIEPQANDDEFLEAL